MTWETSIEIYALGFNLYRADSPTRALAWRLNNAIITGQAMGARYQFVDDMVEPGHTYYYWLEDISIDGIWYYGPVQATVFRSIYLPIVLNR